MYLFYEENCKSELDFRLSRAIDLANCLVYTRPPTTRSEVSKKETAWKKFIDSLDWEKLKERAKPKTVQELFKGLPIPIKMINQKKDVEEDA